MTDTRCPEGAELLLYCSGELAGGDRAAVEEHVAGCAACRSSLSELRRLTAELAAIGEAGRTGPESARSARACPGGEELAGYADGTLGANRARATEHHLAVCRRCLREVADLWRLDGPATHDARDASVAAVVARLETEGRTAIIRLKGRTLDVLQTFASAISGGAPGVPTPTFAVAGSRSDGGAMVLRWDGPGGVRIEAEVAPVAGGTTLTGRVTGGGRPLPSVSVSMRTTEGLRGPESPDSSGRFGPWELQSGDNVLAVSGLPAAGESSAELTVVMDVADEGLDDGRGTRPGGP